MPFNTPDPGVLLGGEQGCTKLRYTSNNDGIKYHGVSKLTATPTDNELNVEETSIELLPKIRSVAISSGNALEGVEDSQGGTVGGASAMPSMIYKTVSLPFGDWSKYLYF